MRITAIKTEKVLPCSTALTAFLDRSLQKFPERSVLAISAKVISLIEGRVAPLTEKKEALLQHEADYFLPKKFRKSGATGTITHHAFIGASGIDESNAAGHFVLLPQDVQKTAHTLYRYLQKRFGIQECGVIITDSHSTPFRRGASGIALSYRGFQGLRDYRGTPDIFGRKLVMEQANIVDGLAAAAVLAMGEGNEQTPLVLIEDVSHITYQANAPTKKELGEFFVSLEDDIFAPLFNLKRLKKGGKKLEKKLC